jgi:hypothetical protein
LPVFIFPVSHSLLFLQSSSFFDCANSQLLSMRTCLCSSLILNSLISPLFNKILVYQASSQ